MISAFLIYSSPFRKAQFTLFLIRPSPIAEPALLLDPETSVPNSYTPNWQSCRNIYYPLRIWPYESFTPWSKFKPPFSTQVIVIVRPTYKATYTVCQVSFYQASKCTLSIPSARHLHMLYLYAASASARVPLDRHDLCGVPPGASSSIGDVTYRTYLGVDARVGCTHTHKLPGPC